MKLYFKNFEIYHLPRRLSVSHYNNFGASGSRMTKRRLLEEAPNSTWQISVQNVISNFLILILLSVSYSLISFNFYLFYFPGVAAEPLGSARGALRAPRSTGWEPVSLGLRGAQVGNLCLIRAPRSTGWEPLSH
jgi:hypothetical protein